MKKIYRMRSFVFIMVLLLSCCACQSETEPGKTDNNDSSPKRYEDNAGNQSETEPDKTDNSDSSKIQYEDNFGDLFRFGIVMVKKDGKYSFINKDNEVVIDSISDNMSDCGLLYYYPVILVPTDVYPIYGYFDLNGEPLIDTSKYTASNESCTYGLLSIMDLQTQKVGYCDVLGNIVIEPQFDADYWFPFGNCDMSAVQIDGKWGYIDRAGSFVIEPQFGAAGNFCEEGVAVVGNGPEMYVSLDDNNTKFALINTSGEMLTDYIFDYVQQDSAALFVDGKGAASINGKCCVIDVSGNVVEYFDEYVSLRDLQEQKRMQGKTIFKGNDKYGIKDENGNIIAEAKFEYVGLRCQEEYFEGFISEYEIVCDYTGKILIGADNKYTEIHIYDDGYIVALKDVDNTPSTTEDDKYGVVDWNGNIIIPFEYDHIG